MSTLDELAKALTILAKTGMPVLEKDVSGKRCMIYCVTHEAVSGIFSRLNIKMPVRIGSLREKLKELMQYSTFKKLLGMPVDCIVEGVVHSFGMDGFKIKAAHSSFELTPEGGTYPADSYTSYEVDHIFSSTPIREIIDLMSDIENGEPGSKPMQRFLDF